VQEDNGDTSNVLAANEQRVNTAGIRNGAFIKPRGTVIADSDIGVLPRREIYEGKTQRVLEGKDKLPLW
jgi:hypothetical protein